MKFLKLDNYMRALNYINIFVEINPKDFPAAIIAGYTRSGTSLIGKTISELLKARYVFEPLNPAKSKYLAHYKERESFSIFSKDPQYAQTIRFIFGSKFRVFTRDQGNRLIYNNQIRIVKIVRANFYLDMLYQLMPDTKFLFIMRNPLGCISSRINLKWGVPDQTHLYKDILPLLNEDQKKILNRENNFHEKMAITWVLDNFMALRNLNNPSFLFLFFEDLILSENKLIEAVRFIKHDFQTPNNLSKYYKPYKGKIKTKQNFEKELGKENVQQILDIIHTFGLSDLYDFDSGLPSR